jgi:hypothetical protein
MATHVGPNALLRTSTYPNVSAAPGPGPLLAVPVPGAGWRIDGSSEFGTDGLCTNWAGSPGSAGAAPAYVYNNLPSNKGGIVGAGGLVIDGFPVPAGTYVFQFMDISSGATTVQLIAPGPSCVFRGCRGRYAQSAPGFWNASPGDAWAGALWLLYCDAGGTGKNTSTQVTDTAIDIESSSGITVYRCYISYVGHMTAQMAASTTSYDMIECYSEKGIYNPSLHFNGGAFMGGGQDNCRIQRNHIVHESPDENGNPLSETSCISLNNYSNGTYGGGTVLPLAGTGTNPDGTPGYQITGNYCGGTGYPFYLGQITPASVSPVTNMTFAGNLLTASVNSAGGADGPVDIAPAWGGSGCTQSGNLWADGPHAGTTFTSPAQVPVTQYTVNYFPIANGGYSMWSSYNGTQYAADMATAKALGFNTLRVILAAQPGVFGFPSPTSPELANWANFYGLAKARGMNLHVTLFDQFGNYGHITDSKTWITAVLGALPDTGNIAVIELQNEIRVAEVTGSPAENGYAAAGGTYDAGWPLSTVTAWTVGQVALEWAQLMIPFIRATAPGIPVTASCSYGTADLAAWYTAANGQSWAPDWWDWHCYAGSPQLAYSAICTALAQVGNNPALLAIGECGFTSAPSGTQGTLQAQQYQADYIQAVRWACAQQGMAEPAPWILFDMEDCAQFPSGQTYGLYSTSGAPNLSGQMYQSAPPGSPAPVGLNGTMQGSQSDSSGNTLPARWSLYLGASQPVSAVTDTGTTYQGSPSVRLYGSAGTVSGNPPALQSAPVTSPVIYPGFTYTFSIALQGSGSTGTTNLEVAWYTSTGTYISSTNGSGLTLTGSFVPYSLNSTAPSTAAYARLFVNVGYNAGSIWAAGASWVLG